MGSAILQSAQNFVTELTQFRHSGNNEKNMQEAKIIDVLLDGRGVADQQGKKVFVPYTVVGETVRYERLKKKRKFVGFEIVPEYITLAQERIRQLTVDD